MNFGDKYIFEFYGVYLLLLVFYISKIDNKRSIVFFIILLLSVNFYNKDQYIYKNNSFSEILKTLGNDSSEAIFIRGNYYDFAHILVSNSLDDYYDKFRFDINYHNYLIEINEISNHGTFKLSNLLNYSKLPLYLVFMESNFDKLNESEKSEILKYYKIDSHKKENFNTYEYLILTLDLTSEC